MNTIYAKICIPISGITLMITHNAKSKCNPWKVVKKWYDVNEHRYKTKQLCKYGDWLSCWYHINELIGRKNSDNAWKII